MTDDKVTTMTQQDANEDLEFRNALESALESLCANAPNVDLNLDTTGRLKIMLSEAEEDAAAHKKGKKIDQSYIGQASADGSDDLELGDEDISDSADCNEIDNCNSDYNIRIKKGKENIQINDDGFGINEAGDSVSEWE